MKTEQIGCREKQNRNNKEAEQIPKIVPIAALELISLFIRLFIVQE